MAELETDSEREERTYQSTLPSGDSLSIGNASVQIIESVAILESPKTVKNDPLPVSSALNDLSLNENDSEIVQNDSELVLNEQVKPVQLSGLYLLRRFKQHCLSVFIIYNVFCLILYLIMY